MIQVTCFARYKRVARSPVSIPGPETVRTKNHCFQFWLINFSKPCFPILKCTKVQPWQICFVEYKLKNLIQFFHHMEL